MPLFCGICKFSSENMSYFTVPKHEGRRRRWIESCGYELEYPVRVCEKHFDDKDFINPPEDKNVRRRLMPGAIPKRYLGQVNPDARRTARTRDQTAVLLKLVHSNKVNEERNDVDEEEIWKQIAETLNEMPGAEKSIEGWKEVYGTWRSQTGKDYEKQLEIWIKRGRKFSQNKLKLLGQIRRH